MKVIYVTEHIDRHVCHYPTQHGTRSVSKAHTRYGLNSVAECECGKRYVLRAFVDDSYIWTRLRWYHFAARQGLRSANAEARA